MMRHTSGKGTVMLKRSPAIGRSRRLARAMRILSAALIVSLSAAPCAARDIGQAQAKRFHAGLRILDVAYRAVDGAEESLTLAVWYPTDEASLPYTYRAEKNYESRVALDATVSAEAAPCPLVLFAHGLYGSGFNGAYLAEHLARQGYVVVAPDYIDTAPPEYARRISFSRINDGRAERIGRVVMHAGWFARAMGRDPEALLDYAARRRWPQTSFVIDEMLRRNSNPSSPFHGAINENAIGISGHSLGGFTALGKIGAHPDPQHQDERIKAAVIFSAPAHPFEKTANGIAVPFMILAGDDDEPGMAPWVPRRTVFDQAPPPKYYLILKDTTHFTFGNRGCAGRPLHRAVSETPQTRAICDYGLAFFDRYLRGDTSAAKTLSRPDPALAYYAGETAPEQSFEFGEEPPPGTGGAGGIRKEFRRNRKDRQYQTE